MKQPLFRRALLESLSTPTATALRTGTIHHPHDATITPKPELRRRSGGQLSPDDPRFIAYAMIGIGGEGAPTKIQHTCNVNYTLSTSGSFYSCCPTSTNVCSFATACVGPSWELFSGGTTSRCASECATGTIYTATNDNSPLFHVGCGYNDYRALRNSDTDLLQGFYIWEPPQVTPFPTIGFTLTAVESAIYATPTPGEVFDPVTEAVWGTGITYTATYHFTKVTGAIVGGIVLVGIIICCFLGRWKRRRDAGKRRPPRVPYAHHQGRGAFYPQQAYSSNVLPPVELQRYNQAHPMGPILSTSPPPQPQQYPVPAYQIFQPQAQRAGYQHILRDESHETNDHEALLPDTNPPPYVEPADEMSRGERHGP